ncbi:MAG: amidohydrolase family protein, partial [Candidatus Binataceae bacterium]
GCIEQGAMWIVPFLKRLDLAQDTFARTEPTIKNLALRASDYVRRHLKFTPYPHEPVGWIIEQAGPELCLFSSDYPHPEGGRNPLKRFESSLQGIGENAKERFYTANFAELMGSRGA